MTTTSCPVPPLLTAFQGLFRRYAMAEHTAWAYPFGACDPVLTSIMAATYDYLIQWYQQRACLRAEIAIAEPLRQLVEAIQGLAHTSMQADPPVVSIMLLRECVLPTDTAYAVVDAVVLLVLDAIQHGATVIVISLSHTVCGIQIRSDTSPTEEVMAAIAGMVQLHIGSARPSYAIDIMPQITAEEWV